MSLLSSKPSKAFRLLLMVLFVCLFSNDAIAQTTLFQFNFENSIDPNVDNVVGTPAFASNGVNHVAYITTIPCQGLSMYTADDWDAGNYYQFTVNTTGFANMAFSFCNSTDAIAIGTFDVRVSADNGANWTTVLASYIPTIANNTLTTATFPIVANNAGTVLIQLYKTDNAQNSRDYLIDNATLTGYYIPTISSFTPNSGCSNSSPVVITGTNFTGVTGVTFEGTNVASYVVNSSTQITAIPAAGATGAIRVITPGGTATGGSSFIVNSTPTVSAAASSASINSGANVTLTASAAPTTQSSILLSEGFNGATNSWTRSSNGSSGGTIANGAWTLRPNGYYYYWGSSFPSYTFHSNDNSQFYLSNSAAQGGTKTTTVLQSPVMNSVGYTSLSLEFYQFYLHYGNADYARVEVSTDGSSWANLSTTTTTQGSENNFLKTTINLNAYINQSTLYIRFKYDAQYDWFWAIDNVTISGNKTINYTYSWTATPSGTAGLPSGSGIASASNNSIVANPTLTSAYTVTATNPVGGCTGTSVVNVTVLSPTISSLGSNSGCVGTSITINGTNLLGATAANVKIGGTAVSSITSITSTQIVAVIGSGTTGNVTVTNSGGTASSSSIFTVYSDSVGGIVTGGTSICSGSASAVLTLTGHTGTITKWQSSVSPFSTWTDIANTTTTYTSGALSVTTQFRAVVQSGSCGAVNSTVTAVTVSNPVTPTGSASQTFCSSTSPTVANLAATGSGIKWYATSSGGSVLATTVALTNETHYYASQTISGCESTTRFDVTATVSNPVAPTGNASQAFCSITSPTVANLAATGSGIKWYSASSGGSALTTTIALTNGTHYYASQTISGCESTTRFDVTTTVSNPVAPIGNTSQTFCSSASPTVANLAATGSGIKWYAASSGGSALAATTALVNTTHYYASQTVSGCESATRFDVTATINAAPAINPNKVDESCPSSNNGSISPTLSGGLTNIRYIKLTQKYATWQQVAEIEAFEIFTGTNVARSTNGATATSSSNYSSLYTAPMAIDGNNSGNNNFWHSYSPNINEWVLVDLQSAKNIDYLKIYNRTDCCQDRGQNMLLELFDSSNNLVYSRTIDLYQSGLNIPVNVNVLDLSWADGATTLNRTVLDSGTYTLNYADAAGCSLSAPIVIGATNSAPATPLVGIITQPDCVAVTGSVVLSGLPATGTWNLYQNGNATPIVSGGTGTTYTVSGLAVGNHTFTVSNGTCTSVASSSIGMIAPVTATWNVVAGIGTWTNGPPTSAKALIFSGNYNSLTDAIIDTVVEGCSCKVNSGAAVVFTAGKTLKITNEVKVLGAGTLTLENNASLVQVNDAAINTGNITVKRNSAPMKLYDYTYWSSPVQNWKLNQLSPNTGYYYSFDPLTNNWGGTNGGNQIMTPGKGYIIRAPQGWSTTNATLGVYNGNFIGVPNSGVVPVAIQKGTGTFNLIGNPYPSAIDIDLFLLDPANSGIINGTIYIWTHNTAISSTIPGNATYNYTNDDYAKYNLTGGIKAALTSITGLGAPTGKIASGQGFFIEANTALANGTYAASFKNSMRVSGNNNQFYRTATAPQSATNTIEKNRIWLNMSNPQGAYNETLLGYVTGATNGFDHLYDGKTFPAGNVLSLYSVLGTDNYSIQGRALPFNASEIIPLGYSTTLSGTFSIAIENLDGFFIDQNVYVYLLDKSNNTTHNLKTSAYSFTTATGTFNNRFELRFTNETLGNDNPTLNENAIMIYSNDQQIKIKSQLEPIEKVIVYDILGRQIFINDKVNSNEVLISDLMSHQTLIVKIILSNGQTVTRKIII